ncbi:MAG: nucleoside-diphosphate sugar epimerase/dehydratase [Candidatus Faecousia sp.]|nr:nucleoside-diphosphate sugar epimerase/dehydratase [Candidatus Faecousia sp.]
MKKHSNIKWPLFFYDILILFIVEMLLLVFSGEPISEVAAFHQFLLTFICVFSARFFWKIYSQIWRYGGIQCYMRLLMTDAAGFFFNYILERICLPEPIPFARLVAIACTNLLGALAIRMIYRYAYKCGNNSTRFGRFLLFLLKMFAGNEVVGERIVNSKRTRIAIIGAGRVGVSLAEDLLNNAASVYIPMCFVDVSKEKVGRDIHDIPVLAENGATLAHMKDMEIQEVVFAIPNMDDETKKGLFQIYHAAGFKVKIYDYPTMQTAGAKRHLREFDIEDLLFRKPVYVMDSKTSAYYRDKVVLITGGGGSIGSELCRQISKMKPRQLIILDVYENCAYDIQQELKIIHPDLDLQVEIVSITNKVGVERVFRKYHPEIVIHAAAHKHVPLMENNCIEAVENNVFGTLNVVQCCEEFGTHRFMMVSTDKAVNPTNVMGATKRLCEMIVQAYSIDGKVKYSATRFGNVLGSAGSVIPLFKRQIAAGGPITLTDKRITRYFMTIPEAAQLVLASGAMANNGELFVLDMGKPVHILDLAESMIHLSGAQGIKIVETGLRPGEKLYEELLVKTEELDKTDNELIFIERDEPVTMQELAEKLALLRQAIATDQEEAVRAAMKQAVPTYKSAQEQNGCALTG